ncbi:hypothetical protein KP509_26G034900 [Ceratopteris richardii]|uniref:FAF domain-containing protein n=1 Tax=Ceratopteris richardii TaxID=49495 RepID=A0A8T2RLJ7_CERRI|nr:hypothetical protein KP509_26G034900 [Ceratopteris richardii]
MGTLFIIHPISIFEPIFSDDEQRPPAPSHFPDSPFSECSTPNWNPGHSVADHPRRNSSEKFTGSVATVQPPPHRSMSLGSVAGHNHVGDGDNEDDDGSVASKLLNSIAKSMSSPSLLSCCKEPVRETPYQKSLKLKMMKLQHCAEELGAESCDNESLNGHAASSGNFDSLYTIRSSDSSFQTSGTASPFRSASTIQIFSNEDSAADEDHGPILMSLPSSSVTSTATFSKRKRSFPPPMSNTLPSSVSAESFTCSLRAYRHQGRLTLREIKVPRLEYLRARRKDGRLTLQLINEDEGTKEDLDQNDSDYVIDVRKCVTETNNTSKKNQVIVSDSCETQIAMASLAKEDENKRMRVVTMFDKNNAESLLIGTSDAIHDDITSEICGWETKQLDVDDDIIQNKPYPFNSHNLRVPNVPHGSKLNVASMNCFSSALQSSRINGVFCTCSISDSVINAFRISADKSLIPSTIISVDRNLNPSTMIVIKDVGAKNSLKNVADLLSSLGSTVRFRNRSDRHESVSLREEARNVVENRNNSIAHLKDITPACYGASGIHTERRKVCRDVAVDSDGVHIVSVKHEHRLPEELKMKQCNQDNRKQVGRKIDIAIKTIDFPEKSSNFELDIQLDKLRNLHCKQLLHIKYFAITGSPCIAIRS